jgi:hypothetical protein
MRYVKQLDINGVEARQTACIELHGAPNAATAGAVGVLGIDVDSPTHEMYKCVAVNGGIYTWEICVSGGAVGSIQLVDDGKGNFTIQASGGTSVNLVNDGEGNFTLEVT